MGKETLQITSLDHRTVKDDQRASLVNDLEDFPLSEDLCKVVKIGSRLPDPLKKQLVSFLKEYHDVFVWTYDNMPGIDFRVLVHRLSNNAKMKPIRHKRRNMNAERSLVVKEEVDKFLKAGFVKKARYRKWLANVVMMKKANKKWRMCVDFIDLYKACPKDNFPLLRIDQLVDATTRRELLRFMNAYSRYNQIKMHESDQEKIASIIDQSLYYCKVMPFGLKNAEATY